MTYVPTVAVRQESADVAELVDALVSGTSGGNIVGVQVSPSALPFTGDCFLLGHDRPEDFKRI